MIDAGFTRVPNMVIDESRLSPYQFQLFSIIVRKTDGWCKVEDGISLSQFEKIVTFKKPKIISTLKELEDLGYIEKHKHFNEATKTYSYSTYKISDRVVCENNKGSNSGLQGVVCEDYKQKKLNTKETNKAEINYEAILNVYNYYAEENNLTKLRAITSKRKSKLITRFKENKNFNLILDEAFKKISESSFLVGVNSKNWKVDFDWLIDNDLNAIKICENKYQNSNNGDW